MLALKVGVRGRGGVGGVLALKVGSGVGVVVGGGWHSRGAGGGSEGGVQGGGGDLPLMPDRSVFFSGDRSIFLLKRKEKKRENMLMPPKPSACAQACSRPPSISCLFLTAATFENNTAAQHLSALIDHLMPAHLTPAYLMPAHLIPHAGPPHAGLPHAGPPHTSCRTTSCLPTSYLMPDHLMPAHLMPHLMPDYLPPLYTRSSSSGCSRQSQQQRRQPLWLVLGRALQRGRGRRWGSLLVLHSTCCRYARLHLRASSLPHGGRGAVHCVHDRGG